ncbi:dehydropantoate 2-reductase [Seminavis robusta]|uniref:2-dehydropantoate 2-reductase n=1 Tax=Seminavis robusta TaxID=568900 RepID=A0A9N8E9C8_9STRA|nr:dehydropantoate 2-reductase [Seminavis robusta]|eukprot:Sro692_g188130.1 dehydropantoate 2-reductase (369) ;mRNA; r:39651-40757
MTVASSLLLRLSTGALRCMSSTHQQVVPFMEPLHVLGGGNIGMLFAASIRAAFPSYPICLLLREHHRSRIDPEDNNVIVCLMGSGRSSRPRLVPVPAQIIGDKSLSQRPIRNLLITTKAYSAVDAVKDVHNRLDVASGASIVVLCNGALAVKDELELMKSVSPDDKINLTLATTTHGAYQVEGVSDMFRFIHTGKGATFVEDHPTLSQLFDQSGLNSKSITQEEMTIMLWQKLAANCAINPLTALCDCENGMLLDKEQQLAQATKKLPNIYQIIQEVALVAQFTLGKNSSQEAAPLDFESLSAFVHKVINDTAHNRSSMLQDVTRRQKTEVDYLNGFVVEKGRATGVDATANEDLCRRMKALWRSYAL